MQTIKEAESTMVRFSLDSMYMDLNEKGEWKKKIKTDKRGWQKLEQTDIKENHKVICLVTGERSKVTIIDLDHMTLDEIQNFVRKYCCQGSCLLCPPAVKTRRGAHLYFKYTPEAKGGQYPSKRFDILNDGQRAYYPGTSYETEENEKFSYEWFDMGSAGSELANHQIAYTYHKLRPMSEQLLNYLRECGALKSSVPQPVAPKAVATNVCEPVATNTALTKFEKEMLDNIDSQLYYSYGDWCKFLWAIKFSFDDTELAYQTAIEYSKRLDNWESELTVKNKMDEAKDKRIGWGFLMNLSKRSNKKEHYLIIAKHHDYLKPDDYNVAMLAIRLCGDDVIRTSDNEFYIYSYPYWVKDACGELRVKICNVLRDFYSHLNRDFADKLKEADDDEDAYKKYVSKQKEIVAMLDKINSHFHSKQVYGEFMAYLPKSSIEFDTYKPYYFCFTNCAFNLENNSKVKVLREDYITQTTGYDYVPASPEKLEQIKNLMKQIFPKEDNLKCYISILRSCMIGKVFEKFILANGGGGNGKGLINSLMEKMLGTDYFYRASITTLTEKMKDGANPRLLICIRSGWL